MKKQPSSRKIQGRVVVKRWPDRSAAVNEKLRGLFDGVEVVIFVSANVGRPSELTPGHPTLQGEIRQSAKKSQERLDSHLTFSQTESGQ